MPTVTRAFELPLHHMDGDWALLRECWSRGTDLANWAVQQLFRADVMRNVTMERLPKLPFVDLYALAFGRATVKKRRKDAKDQAPLPIVRAELGGADWWAGAAISASSILQMVKAKYVEERLSVLWHRNQALHVYRYPMPWPVHGQGWKSASLDENGRPVVVLALPGGPLTLQLRGGPEFGRQMGLFRQVVNGTLPRKQLVIRQQGASPGCHRPTLEDGGKQQRVMVKMVADFEVPEVRSLRTLTLCKDPGAFWVAGIDGRQAWALNADHVRRIIEWRETVAAIMERLRQDAKAERRMAMGCLGELFRSMERCSAKQARRMSSWLHESAAHLVGFARRQHVGLVLYRDVQTGYCDSFPWFALKQLLKDKLLMAGIRSHCLSDGPAPDEFLFSAPIKEKECLESQQQNEKAGKRLLKAARRSGSHPVVSVPSGTVPT